MIGKALFALSGLAATTAGPAAAQAISSAYTNIDLQQCRRLAAAEESASFRCPGLGRIALFVDADDSRMDVDAGVDNNDWESLPGLNEIGGPIEWRLRGGRPFAIIYRLRLTATDQPPGSSLIVETIGRPGAPGCQIATVDGALPDANARARAIADRQARGHRCGEQGR